MKRLYIFIVILVLFLTGCAKTTAPAASSAPESPTNRTMTDSTGAEVSVTLSPKSVVALSASLAELWLEAGGKITGTTSDTLEKGRLDISRIEQTDLSAVQNVGAVSEPSAELILALKPDFVILSASMSGHKAAAKVLEEAHVPFYFADADSFSDYLEVFKDFTDLTDRADLYEKYGQAQKVSVDKMLQAVSSEKKPTALALRAFSSGVSAKAAGTVLTNILDSIGVTNIASNDKALVENLSLEKVVEDNPDYIFIVYMGQETEKTENYLHQNLYADPVWGTLSAVHENRIIILPQDLFHFKPNGRWEEAYSYLLKILYPQ